VKAIRRLVVIILATLVLCLAISWCLREFDFRTASFAFLLNWLVVSWVRVVFEVASISFGEGYFRPRAFEREGRTYEYLGVRIFKKLMLNRISTILNASLRFSGRLDSLKQLETATRAAETAHAIVFLMMLLPTAYALTKGWLDAAGWMMLFNIPLNMYPVMLQRYNRMRLQRLMQKRRFHRPMSINGGS
jgi:hypothetical protein